MSGPDLVGWAATATFAASYFCRDARVLRLTQAGAALLWLGYGVALAALPVIVANVIVASLALWSAWSAPRPGQGGVARSPSSEASPSP